MTPCESTNPYVGRNPITLLADEGVLIDAFVSVPNAATARPDATATALPPLDPYGE